MALDARAYVLQFAATELQMIRLGREVTFEYSLPDLSQRRIATQLAFANRRLVWRPVTPAEPPADTDVPPLPTPYALPGAQPHAVPEEDAPPEPFEVRRERSPSPSPFWEEGDIMGAL